MLQQHGVSSKEPNYHQPRCEECEKHAHHTSEAKTAREAYRRDADSNWDEDTAYFSADMMKVS